MLRKIELPHWLNARAPRIITRQQLGHAKRAEHILGHAKAVARQTIEQAQAESAALHQRTTQDAYHHAFRLAAAAIAAFLADAANLHQKLVQDAQEKLAAQLRSVGCHPKIVHDLLTSCLPSDDTQPALILYTPKGYPHQAELDALLRTRFNDVQWRHTTADGSYAIEVGEQAWEVNFSATAEPSTQSIMRHAKTSTDYDNACAKLISTLHNELLKKKQSPTRQSSFRSTLKEKTP